MILNNIRIWDDMPILQQWRQFSKWPVGLQESRKLFNSTKAKANVVKCSKYFFQVYLMVQSE